MFVESPTVPDAGPVLPTPHSVNSSARNGGFARDRPIEEDN